MVLQESSYQLERENVRLLAGKEELEHTCGKQKQQLAEARGQAKQRRLQSDTETEQLKTELGVMEEEVKRLKDREEKVCFPSSLVIHMIILACLSCLSSELPQRGCY